MLSMFEKDLALLELMIQSIERILEYTSHIPDVEEFVKDYKSYDATMMKFIALGESVGKLSDKFKDKYSTIEWRKIYAFRNIIAHDYFGIDEYEVWEIIKTHLPKLKNDLEHLSF